MLRRYLPLFVSTFLISAAAHAQVTVRSQGQFTDKGGAVHRWYINAAHTMIWDDAPFVPVGGLFQAKSWMPNSTKADYDSDVAALTVLKAHGITDIYVQPARGGITAVKAEDIQRLVDYLDNEGFTYGISLNDGPREPLIGYIVRPGAFRQLVPSGGGELHFTVPDLASALYFTVGSSGTEVREEGEAPIVGDGVRLTPVAPPDLGGNNDDSSRQNVVLLVPERIYTPASSSSIGGNIGMRNLWEGFDTYRDTLISLFQNVHLGKGFRFLCDPLPADLALTDTFARFIPTSSEFRTEWSTYLSKKYRSTSNLMQSWGVMDRSLETFDEGAQLIPLWSGGKGIAFYYHTGLKTRLRADSTHSAFWTDLAAFKAESVRGYMNDLAVSLKRTVADVPVVYRNAPSYGWNELFASLPPSRGFDGFGIVAYGRGADLAVRSSAYSLAQAAEAPKTIWLPVLATADSPFVSGKGTVGYDSKVSLTGSFDWLRDSGAKGFYVTGVRITDPARQAFDLSTVPDQLDWLRDYATVLTTSGMRTRVDSPGAAQTPATVFYPRREIFDLSPTALTGGNGWWLPTSRAGQVYDFGTVGRAYGIDEPGAGTVYYLWSQERQIVHIPVPKSALNPKNGGARVAWSTNAAGSIKKDALVVTIGPEPIRILNLPTIPVPLETVSAIRSEADALIKTAKQDKDLSAGRYGQELGSIRVDKEAPYNGVTQMLAYLANLKRERRDYIWIEAEATGAHSFDEASERTGASGNKVLRVDDRLDNAPAIAQYRVVIPDNKPMDVWVSMTPDALVSLRIDGHPLINEATIPQKIGNLYADGTLVWTHFGLATIPKGEHILEVRADGPALIDAILLTHKAFTPDGPDLPPVTPD